MPPTETEVFAALDQKLTELQSDDQLPADFVAVSRELTRALQRRDWPIVEAAYARAAELAAQGGDPATEALSLYGQGTALFQLDRLAEARPHFQRAAELAERIGHTTLAAKAHYLFAGALLTEAELDLDAVLAAQTRALELLDAAKEPELAAQIHHARASLRGARLDPEAANADFEAALALARQANNPQLVTLIENNQQLFKTLGTETPDFGAFLDALDAQTQILGLELTPADRQLRKAISALHRQDVPQALTLAEAARQESLQATDVARYFRYFSACFVIAAAREAAEDYPGVIEIMLTCKGTVEKVIGPEAGEVARAFLDTLPQRWGAEKFAEALQTYRAQIRAKMNQ